MPYGHFGDGCVHVRIDFDFDDGGRRSATSSPPCAARLREYGGSLSGEHGDGRARSELLPLMYDDGVAAPLRRGEGMLRPRGLLNPGVLVDPAPLDADLRPARPRTDAGSVCGCPRRRLPGHGRASLHRRRQVRRARTLGG